MKSEKSNKFDEIEDSANFHFLIDALAKQATGNAYQNALNSGVAVTYSIQNKIVTEFPDGRIVVIADNLPLPRKVSKGIIGKL